MKIERISLPQIAVIGKEGLCTKENNCVAALWEQTNQHFAEVAPLGMKEKDGSYVGFWGCMSDEEMNFLPWKDGFTRGLYLAGIEVYSNTPVPEGWKMWVMPARSYLVCDVDGAHYGEIFKEVIEKTIPDMGLELSGAVCDYTRPATGQNRLFFPVRERS